MSRTVSSFNILVDLKVLKESSSHYQLISFEYCPLQGRFHYFNSHGFRIAKTSRTFRKFLMLVGDQVVNIEHLRPDNLRARIVIVYKRELLVTEGPLSRSYSPGVLSVVLEVNKRKRQAIVDEEMENDLEE